MTENGAEQKLHGRAFYESLGSPRYVVAPMVDASEFAWRLLTRSFMPPSSSKLLLGYTPMFHARMFAETPKYRDSHFQPIEAALPAPATNAQPEDGEWNLDGNPTLDRPLFVQFCANKADEFLSAAQLVAPYCDAVDLNLGCPQGIAKRGGYGAFLQEDWPTISALISKLHAELSVPVTAKFRVQETKEKTLEYAKMILDAGASIITVHGRQRHQKGHNTGLADWTAIRYLRDNLPAETVIFANGNILQHADIDECLAATGADAIMSAEGNLHDPTIFAPGPPAGEEGREYFRPSSGAGGYRMDAVLRRYLDILHTHVCKQAPPARAPLYIYGETLPTLPDEPSSDGPPPKKKMKRAPTSETTASGTRSDLASSPNMVAVQAHLFRMLRPLVAKHTDIRDMLARTRSGDIDSLERILTRVEVVVAQGIKEETEKATPTSEPTELTGIDLDPTRSSFMAARRCARPWFVCQAYVRPLPEEALLKGALQVSKKDKRRLEAEQKEREASEAKVETVEVGSNNATKDTKQDTKDTVDLPKEGLVCG